MQPNRDTKAELNRRSQACEGPGRHRCSRRVKWSSIRVLRPVFRFGRPACFSQHLCPERKSRSLRIQSLCRSFNRIRRVLPDTASQRFHATRPRPQSRKPAWLPFYTGGGSSLRLVPSAFIFRLPCGQQTSITPPCESNRPPSPLRGGGRPDCAHALRD